MIRVLLVDDHAVVRTGFRLLLQAQSEISVVGEADSGEAAGTVKLLDDDSELGSRPSGCGALLLSILCPPFVESISKT